MIYSPIVVAKIVLPSPAPAVSVDRVNRQLLVSAYDEGIYVVDFDGQFSNEENDRSGHYLPADSRRPASRRGCWWCAQRPWTVG